LENRAGGKRYLYLQFLKDSLKGWMEDLIGL